LIIVTEIYLYLIGLGFGILVLGLMNINFIKSTWHNRGQYTSKTWHVFNNKILVLCRFSLPYTQQVSVLFWAVAVLGCDAGATVDCTECFCCVTCWNVFL